jgi:hypothetical protein
MALLKLHSELDQQRMAVLEPHIREKPGNITPLAKKKGEPNRSASAFSIAFTFQWIGCSSGSLLRSSIHSLMPRILQVFSGRKGKGFIYTFQGPDLTSFVLRVPSC